MHAPPSCNPGDVASLDAIVAALYELILVPHTVAVKAPLQ
jgi:hypothetical protein